MTKLTEFEKWLFDFNTFQEYRDTVRDLPAFKESVRTLVEDFGEGQWEIPDDEEMTRLHTKFWREVAPQDDD